jgi:hypothetical protein
LEKLVICLGGLDVSQFAVVNLLDAVDVSFGERDVVLDYLAGSQGAFFCGGGAAGLEDALTGTCG